MKKIAVSLFGLAIVFASFARVPFAHAYGSGTIMLSASDASVSTGEEFSISVWVDPAGESVDTVRVNLNFNPALVEAVYFDLANQFPSLSPGYTINNTTGLVSFGAFKFGDRVTESGLFATVTFKALSAGTATIQVGGDSKLINNGQEKVSATGFGSVIVATSGDEEQALAYFGAFAGRMPSSDVDWEALHCMAYDTCYPTDPAMRKVEHERISLEVFGAKYGHIPATSMDWKALHAIAYTEIFYDWSSIDGTAAPAAEATEEAPEAMEEEEEVADEADVSVAAWGDSIDANEAIGIFGFLTGRLPSSPAEWTAIDYMQNGYAPASKDAAFEDAAISLFGSAYGRLPSSSADWNVTAAIAYSGAIL
jgi:hypothetical protein